MYSLKVSFLEYNSDADSGTGYSNNVKYFTSLNNLTKAGSKLTLNNPFSSFDNKGYFYFSSETLPTSCSQLKILVYS